MQVCNPISQVSLSHQYQSQGSSHSEYLVMNVHLDVETVALPLFIELKKRSLQPRLLWPIPPKRTKPNELTPCRSMNEQVGSSHAPIRSALLCGILQRRRLKRRRKQRTSFDQSTHLFFLSWWLELFSPDQPLCYKSKQALVQFGLSHSSKHACVANSSSFLASSPRSN